MKPAEAYILNKPEPFKSILMHLQMMVEHTFNDVNLKYKWHLPFYYIEKRPFCYLNFTKGYVDLAFMSGNRMTKHLDKLVGENRKLVRSLRYKTLEDIDDEILLEVLMEGYHLTLNK